MAPLGAAAMSGVVTTLGAAGQPTATASVWKLDRFHPTRRAAHVLYAWLKRQVPRLQRVRAEVEDGLLALLRESAPARPGYRTFTEFAAAEFGLAERTARDGLRRAQRRLGVDLLSQALADGRVCEVPGAELERLLRRAGIPRSRGGPWIERASGVTVRELRDMIEWAIGESHQNYCDWSVNGYLPLTEEQLRAARTSLQTMAENPQPPDLKTQQLLRQMPMVTLEWVQKVEAAAALAQQLCSVEDRVARDGVWKWGGGRQAANVRGGDRDGDREGGHGGDGPPLFPCRPPMWWSLLILFAMARRAWADLAQLNTFETFSILDRDQYRWVAPGCGRRCGMESHHTHDRSQMGKDELENRATLCASHHRLGEHGGILRVRGRAIPEASALVWEMGIDPEGRPARIYRGDTILVKDARRPRQSAGA